MIKPLIFTLAALPLLSFCAFGFLATFEAMPPVTQWIWRCVYLGTALLTVFGLVYAWLFPRGQKP